MVKLIFELSHRAARDRSLELIPIHPAARIPRRLLAVKCPQVDCCIDVLFRRAEDADAGWAAEQFVSIQSKLVDLANSLFELKSPWRKDCLLWNKQLIALSMRGLMRLIT